ncbi:hypothetical protein D1AOALGA4SA_12124 [Olavius algarvensis Delta 1 endosymbiont]|nr:hypothetical protein D1AOALGA4SA_12124 [Olavius algarvensis Delta 1 endosymbiont]
MEFWINGYRFEVSFNYPDIPVIQYPSTPRSRPSITDCKVKTTFRLVILPKF